MQKTYSSEAVGNEILIFQFPSNNAHTMCKKKKENHISKIRI